MVNKAYRITIGDIKNREKYLEEHPMCEICGKEIGNIHHKVPQQFTYKNDTWIIDLEENYASLGLRCHGIIDHSGESQYNRELLGIERPDRTKNVKPYSYWKTINGDKPPEAIIEDYLRTHDTTIIRNTKKPVERKICISKETATDRYNEAKRAKEEFDKKRGYRLVPKVGGGYRKKYFNE